MIPRGDAVRPATDALRQAVFSSLAQRVAGARFLDLFAGSGAYGLEALSRGAEGGVFVERDPAVIGCLRRNIAAVCRSVGAAEVRVSIRGGDAGDPPVVAEAPPDLVFVDPPYEMISAIAPRLFQRLGERLDLSRDPLVVFEMPGDLSLDPGGWTLVRRLGKGGRQPTACVFRSSRAAP